MSSIYNFRNVEAQQQRIKITTMRKSISSRLKQSQNTAVSLTIFNEIDMSEVILLRKNYQKQFQEKYGIKLGLMSFFVKAVIHSLKEIPILNSEIEEDYIVYKQYYNIGVAVGIDHGLVVPVLKDADKYSFEEIEKAIITFSNKAKNNKLTTSEMLGGTFTITNAGTYGSLLATPIINPPQSGILGMHNIITRPVVVNGRIVIKPMMYVSLSYDYRIVEEKDAVNFLIQVKRNIESPKILLLNI